MTTEEHQQAVNKLCASLEKLSPEEIPPLVHQLLQLCREEHAVTVFLTLSKYFKSNIYSDETMKPIAESTKNNSSSDDSIGKDNLQLFLYTCCVYIEDWLKIWEVLMLCVCVLLDITVYVLFLLVILL